MALDGPAGRFLHCAAPPVHGRQRPPGHEHMTEDTDRETRAVRAALDSDEQHGAVMPPIVLSTNFSFERFGQPRRYDYTRTANPTRDALGAAITELEGGAGTTITASGMAAVTLACQLLNPGDLVARAHRLLRGHVQAAQPAGGARPVPGADVRSGGRRGSLPMRPASRRGWYGWSRRPIRSCESSISGACDCLQTHAARLLVVDNTFLSPALQQPIRLGADLVIHSTTKYINGHSDIVGGAVVARSPELHARACRPGPTLSASRARRSTAISRCVACARCSCACASMKPMRPLLPQLLSTQPAVTRVFYPGLPGHPGHDLATPAAAGLRRHAELRTAWRASGGAQAFLEALELFSLAESLGGVESLACHPATMTHVPLGPEGRAGSRNRGRAGATVRGDRSNRGSAGRRAAGPWKRASRGELAGVQARDDRPVASPISRRGNRARAGRGNVRRAKAGLQHIEHCLLHGARFCLERQGVPQQHGHAENGPAGIGDALSGDVRRRAVDRFVQARDRCSFRDAEGSIPREPTSMEASSVRMSPNMFSVTITSKSAGRDSRCMAAASTSRCSSCRSGNSRANSSLATTAPESRGLQHVGLVDRSDLAAPASGQLRAPCAAPARFRCACRCRDRRRCRACAASRRSRCRRSAPARPGYPRPARRSGFRGEAANRAGWVTTGRRLAYTPMAARRSSRPCSGRSFAGVAPSAARPRRRAARRPPRD